MCSSSSHLAVTLHTAWRNQPVSVTVVWPPCQHQFECLLQELARQPNHDDVGVALRRDLACAKTGLAAAQEAQLSVMRSLQTELRRYDILASCSSVVSVVRQAAVHTSVYGSTNPGEGVWTRQVEFVACMHACRIYQFQQADILVCRVHTLESMCLRDVTEINTLHHQLHASQRAAWGLREIIFRASMSKSITQDAHALPDVSID